jgi:hypothetical protein
MAHVGARGGTAQEIKAGMKFPVEDEVLHQGYAEVLASLQVSHVLVLDKLEQILLIKKCKR